MGMLCRLEVDGVTGKRRDGGWERVIRGVGSVTGRSSLPRERPLQGDGGGDTFTGPATELIGNLLARPPAGEGITGPGTEECLQEKKNLLSSGFLAMRERYVKWVVVKGSTVDRTRGGQKGQERREWGRIYSGILFLWRPVGNAPTLGLAFEFSAIRGR
ncbi:hypothetical protein GBF38_004560 [Nibea albiflora]|uniref:Uncharacterized protein n=1 Tax=Nibea albiflora TaxID=240163 RepID=A0ACB7FE35_NIBAL|nr:hypothetical protein GBF38_004560 [Nibea albiflora]